MAEPRTDVTPPRAAADTDPAASEAFALLADETRLAVLLALWAAEEPGSDGDGGLTFSELFERVEYGDDGNFSYHLDRLDGQYVTAGDDGYALTHTGRQIVQSVIGGAGIDRRSRDPEPVERPCPHCGAETTVSYADGVLTQRCTSCAGTAGGEDLPEGYLNSIPFAPAGLADRSPDELLRAAELAAYRHLWSMVQGICPECSGPVEGRLEHCEDHAGMAAPDAEDGVCPACDRATAITATFRCRTCKAFHGTTPAVVTAFDPGVVAFSNAHDRTPRWHADWDGDPEPSYETTVDATDPLRVAVTIDLDGATCRVVLDGTASVVDVEW